MTTNDWQSGTNAFGPTTVVDDGSSLRNSPHTYADVVVAGYVASIIDVGATNVGRLTLTLNWYDGTAHSNLLGAKTIYSTDLTTITPRFTVPNLGPILSIVASGNGGAQTQQSILATPTNVRPLSTTTQDDYLVRDTSRTYTASHVQTFEPTWVLEGLAAITLVQSVAGGELTLLDGFGNQFWDSGAVTALDQQFTIYQPPEWLQLNVKNTAGTNNTISVWWFAARQVGP